ncbi:MAG: type I-E CRISPR-associated endoribonuclease Cas2e [Bifidobacteriaceae bacterium]|jgi:CRISPR-associated protein Cas2|nr:type I-E CRISPR-associated endoribonuclease Cas2e [Bifidobacteriaceae bacterium]
MVVLVLTACPEGLRGLLTRWLLEISPGVFVGHVTKRVRESIWEHVRGMANTGRALMVHTARNEQHLEFKVHRHDWRPTDFDGVVLMLRPDSQDPSELPATAKKGWSSASIYRRARRRAA